MLGLNRKEERKKGGRETASIGLKSSHFLILIRPEKDTEIPQEWQVLSYFQFSPKQEGLGMS